MLKMGVLISLQGMLAILASYFIRIFISRMGSIDDVGLFNAGFTIVNTYVGLVFTAMATDYYPRLSAIASDNDSFVRAINSAGRDFVTVACSNNYCFYRLYTGSCSSTLFYKVYTY